MPDDVAGHVTARGVSQPDQLDPLPGDAGPESYSLLGLHEHLLAYEPPTRLGTGPP